MSAHALLSPSAAKRWINCPPSVRLTEDMEETFSEYAAEGTVAHSLAEVMVRYTWLGYNETMTENAICNLEAANPKYYNAEMVNSVNAYVEAIAQIVSSYPEKPYIAVEVRLDCSRWIPECFGTGDCIVIGNGVMDVIDLKYGKGVAVEAENNPQMMIYALGAIDMYGVFYDIDTVRLNIIQPRLGGVQSWSVKKADLLDWANTVLKPAADKAFKGEGEYCAGDWCRFCKARNRCETRTNTEVLTRFEPIKNPLIDNAELAKRIMTIAPYIAIYDDLKSLALTECLEGRDVPGFKAVEGRATRCWTDCDEALKAAKAAGYDEAVLYKREPLTLAAMEKMMGKKLFSSTLGDYVTTPPGKPTLVEASDKRSPIEIFNPEQRFTKNTEVEYDG